jgi:hypothetical protein
MPPRLPSPPPACPRCRGKLFTARDQHGTYSSCLGCGFVHEWLSGPAVTRPDEGEDGRRRRTPTHGRHRL